jgi:hypothetical protein
MLDFEWCLALPHVHLFLNLTNTWLCLLADDPLASGNVLQFWFCFLLFYAYISCIGEETNISLAAVLRFENFTAVTMKNVVFWDIKTQSVPHRRHIMSPLQSPSS